MEGILNRSNTNYSNCSPNSVRKIPKTKKNELKFSINTERLKDIENNQKLIKYINSLAISENESQHYICGELNQQKCLFDNVIDILKNKKMRNQNEIKIIAKYLANTNLLSKFSKDNLNERTKSLKYFCSMVLSYEYMKPNETLFRIHDSGDKFYIILKGHIGVFKPIETIVNLKFFEFMEYLDKLKYDKEYYMFSRCVESNKYTIESYLHKYDEISNNNPVIILSPKRKNQNIFDNTYADTKKGMKLKKSLEEKEKII